MLVAVTIAFLTTVTIGGIMLLIRDVVRVVQSIRSIQFGDHCEQSEILAEQTLPRVELHQLNRVLYRLGVASYCLQRFAMRDNLPSDQ